jgi:hypothetical protein
MIVKVLKSPSSVGHINGNKLCLFYTARPSVVWYTPNARCVLHIRITDIDNNELSSLLMGHTSVLPALCEKVCASLPIKRLQRYYHCCHIGNTGNTIKWRYY